MSAIHGFAYLSDEITPLHVPSFRTRFTNGQPKRVVELKSIRTELTRPKALSRQRLSDERKADSPASGAPAWRE